jgi:serine/threonine-protein kinase RsbW
MALAGSSAFCSVKQIAGAPVAAPWVMIGRLWMTDGDRIVVSVPSRGEYARTVRLVAAELATRAGMDIDTIDDVRMAVEEAFVFASEHASSAQLEFTFQVVPGSVELSVGPLVADCVDDEAPDRGERYARFILESICDEFEVVESGGSCLLRLVKSAG